MFVLNDHDIQCGSSGVFCYPGSIWDADDIPAAEGAMVCFTKEKASNPWPEVVCWARVVSNRDLFCIMQVIP